MNIIEFIEDAALIGDKGLSPAQVMMLKAAYGLDLTPDEIVLFKLTTNLPDYISREWAELTLILGRRSGKSDKLASNIALYEACAREHGASKGEIPVVMVVASELERQARIVFKYIEAKLDASAVLRRMVKRRTAYEIELRSGVLIQVYPASQARIRGASICCFIGDENAFWKHEGRSIDREIIEAARPGLSFAHSKLVKISSPYWQKGEIWNDYKQFFGVPNEHILVFKGSTELFNPGYSKVKLEAARLRDPVSFNSEFEANFRQDLTAMFDLETIDAAIDADRPAELEPQPGRTYGAFVDVAGGGGIDHYALAIGHLEEGRVVVDMVRSRAPKFNPQEVTAQFAELARSYGIVRLMGDKFSGDWASTEWAGHGFVFERKGKSKSELYIEAEGLFQSGRISLPPRKALIAQLRSLVRKARVGGRDQVDAEGGEPEDEANVACGLAVLLGKGAAGPSKGRVYVCGERTSGPPDPPGMPTRRRVFFCQPSARTVDHDELIRESLRRGRMPPPDDD